MIIWEQRFKITDRVIVVRIKDIAGLLDAASDITSVLDIDERTDIYELGTDTTGGSVLAELSDESLGVFKELARILHS